jgi:tetratricopeptide (TPR) repeat protein
MKPAEYFAGCLVVLSMLLAGCPKSGSSGGSSMLSRGPKVIVVSEDDPAEMEAAKSLVLARATYRFRLEALGNSAKLTGDARKQTWAQREAKNLEGARTVRWEGLGQLQDPPADSLAQANTAMLVELVVAARAEYLAAADRLMEIYQGRQEMDKVALMDESRAAFNPIRTYLYFLPAEVPSSDLRATEMNPGAEGMFEQAMKLYADSRKVMTTLRAQSKEKRLEALKVFQSLVNTYPRSSKIGSSAFYIAEIYRSFDEDFRAGAWYDRAWQWDASVPEPVRHRTASLYDYKLGSPEKALEYYELAIKHESTFRQYMDKARRRVKELRAAR